MSGSSIAGIWQGRHRRHIPRCWLASDMARYMDDDEAEAELTAAMGPELGAVVHQLSNELVAVLDDWREYRQLFGTSEKRIDLLARAANRFFGVLQETLFETTLLHIARLTDAPEPGRKPALTIRRLESLITDPVLRGSVSHRVSRALKCAQFARDWRNRHIAHRDLLLALDKPTDPLAVASRKRVQVALDAIANVLNHLHMHYLQFRHDYRLIPGGPGDALDLLAVLSLGVKAREARDRRLEAGESLPGDSEPPDY